MYCRHYEGFLVLQCIQERLCSARQEHHRSHFCTSQRTAGENIHKLNARAKKIETMKTISGKRMICIFDRRATKIEMRKTISGKRKICFPHVQVDGRASEGESANLDHLCHRERFTIDLLCKQLLLVNKSKTTLV